MYAIMYHKQQNGDINSDWHDWMAVWLPPVAGQITQGKYGQLLDTLLLVFEDSRGVIAVHPPCNHFSAFKWHNTLETIIMAVLMFDTKAKESYHKNTDIVLCTRKRIIEIWNRMNENLHSEK